MSRTHGLDASLSLFWGDAHAWAKSRALVPRVQKDGVCECARVSITRESELVFVSLSQGTPRGGRRRGLLIETVLKSENKSTTA